MSSNEYRLQFLSAALTDTGRKRRNNEDAVLHMPEHGVFCVADGMGGAAEGEVASRAVVYSLQEEFSRILPSESEPNVERSKDLVRNALERAGRRVNERAASRGTSGTGTTVAALVFGSSSASDAVAMHAGDSRVYRLRDGILKQVTRDHSMANFYENEHEMPPFFRNIITRAIGVDSSMKPEETPVDAQEGDLFLLCSDGLTRMVPDDRLAGILAGHSTRSLDALCRNLIDEANASGGEDNISAVLVRVERASTDKDGTGRAEGMNLVKAAPVPLESELGHIRESVRKLLKLRNLIMLSALFAALALASVAVWRSVRAWRSSDTWDAPEPGVLAATSGKSSDAARRTIRVKMADTLRTGRWGDLMKYVADRAPAAQRVIAEDAFLQRTYEAWCAEWAKASSEPERCEERHEEWRRAASDLLAKGGLAPLPETRTDWRMPDGETIASSYCAAIYDGQKHTLDVLGEQVDAELARTRIFSTEPESQARKLWATARLKTELTAEALSTLVVRSRNNLRTLKDWLDGAEYGPLSPSDLRACPVAALSDISRDNRQICKQLWILISQFDARGTWREHARRYEAVRLQTETINALQSKIVDEKTRNGWDIDDWAIKASCSDIRQFLLEMETLYGILRAKRDAERQ